MGTTSLIAEFMVIGILPFGAALFGVLSILGIYNLGFLTQARDYATLLCLFAVPLVYLFGTVAHRISQLLNAHSLAFVVKSSKIRRFLGLDGTPLGREKWWPPVLYINQYGSKSVADRFAYGESLLRIYKSTTVFAPLCGWSVAAWLSGGPAFQAVPVTLGLTALVTVASVIGYLVQRRNQSLTVETALRVIRSGAARTAGLTVAENLGDNREDAVDD